MSLLRKSRQADEFGDFQTPSELTERVCKLLASRGLAPVAIVEPTCGVGNFLIAALDRFPTVSSALGVEINPAYVSRLTEALRTRPAAHNVKVIRADFFRADWAALLRALPEPILVIGNPPWVTNAQLGVLGSANLPTKSNFQQHRGLGALTGQSNFDISEWMLIRLLELLDGRTATVAMLCKTAVARKVLLHAWKNDLRLSDAEIRPIDAAATFGAAVDACLLIGSMDGQRRGGGRVYQHWEDDEPARVIGCRDGRLLADVAAYDRWKHLEGDETTRWRSGIKHDCARVMELRMEGGRYRNGLGELVELEDDYLFPMRKGSELAHGHADEPHRWMLVTQRSVGDDTSTIRTQAPRTWRYLQRHDEALDRRASSIYRNRARFSIFGVGAYSFSPWKVAISGFAKSLRFTVVGPCAGKPIVLDDTAYFLACQSEQEAGAIASLLRSEAAREFYSALIFWDAKRPITVEVLRRLDLSALGRELGAEETRDLTNTVAARALRPRLKV